MTEDAELLRRYVEERSEDAFAELVRRHLNLVYFAALRQVGGDAHRAHDVAQTVFTDLARKARPLMRHAVLTGWLYTSTHFAAAKAVRTEQRRHAREQEAHMLHEDSRPNAPEADWNRLRPVLDDVMLELNERDREAVLLRYFEGRPFADVGQRLRLSEDAARMRVERALDKLRGLLSRRGVSSTSAALGLALSHQVTAAAPAGLALAVTGAALSGAAAGSGAATGSVLTFFAMNKFTMGVSGMVAAAGVSGFVVQQQTNTALREEIAALRAPSDQVATITAQNRELANTAAEVARLRQDDVELARLQTELGAVKQKLAESARVAANAAAAKRQREDALRANLATNPAVDLKLLDQMPRPTVQAKPVYPMEMKRAGIAGEVVVAFIVGANGEVANPVVVSSTRREFEAAATEAISKWKFDPGVKGGRQVNTRMQIPITFSVAGQGEAGTPSVQQEPPRLNNWF